MTAPKPNTSEIKRLQIEGAQLRIEGRRIRLRTKRLRLDCAMARCDLAENMAVFAHQQQNNGRLERCFGRIALESYRQVHAVVSQPSWSDMDRAALQTRFARLRDLFLSLALIEPGEAQHDLRPEPRLESPPPAGQSRSETRGLLTQRELQVLQCIAEGHNTKEVAHRLGISFKTAACHRYHIQTKLDIHETAGLVRYAIKNQIIQV